MNRTLAMIDTVTFIFGNGSDTNILYTFTLHYNIYINGTGTYQLLYYYNIVFVRFMQLEWCSRDKCAHNCSPPADFIHCRHGHGHEGIDHA